MQLRDSRNRLRKGRVVATLAGTASLLALLPATGASADGGREDGGVSTYAVYGDSPYGADHAQYNANNATPAFIGGINADPQVGGVINIGDLHSGSEVCTQVYDQGVADMWKALADPVYYTPGDNEWADCQKVKPGDVHMDKEGFKSSWLSRLVIQVDGKQCFVS